MSENIEGAHAEEKKESRRNQGNNNTAEMWLSDHV